MSRGIRWHRALLAIGLGAAGGLLVSTGAAQAAACPAGTGVTVVVGSDVRCDANGGGSAASNLADAGFSLTYVKTQPGFICQISGYPGNTDCVRTPPPNAYWGIFHSNGTSGSWTYSTSGIGSLSIPPGGWLGLRFQTGSGPVSPGVTPLGPAAAPKPTVKPTPKPGTPTASGPSSTGSSSTPSSPTPSASASPIPTPSPDQATPAAEATATPDEQMQARDEAIARTSQETGASSMLWIGGALGLTLLIAMGITIWQRRTRQV